VASFEAEFARFCGARYSVGVGSGTQALEIALWLSGILPGRNQEVITTPLTAAFTAHAIVAAGARPVFADVDPVTLLLDPAAVRRCISRRTAAILPVHLYGQACDLDALRLLAEETGCALIQDAAQAHGAQWNVRPLAHYSDWTAFSFYPTKNLGCLGDGGALVTDRGDLAEQARRFRDGGRARGHGHVAQTAGINSRLDEVQAAILRIHLRRLPSWNRTRARLAALYDRLLAAHAPGKVLRPAAPSLSRSSHHLYIIRTRHRGALRNFLAQRGIATAIHYQRPLHLQPAFRWLGYQKGDFPAAERAAREVCSLPLDPFLRPADLRRIALEIGRFFDQL
jgi:dTDP-4-amino-4,6-dideoxygalactose transaminase